MNDEQKRRNRRTGLVLLSVALVFMLGYIARRVFFGV